MARVFLSLGSNLGDRRAFIADALRQLAATDAVEVVACSPVYETEPWPEQRVARERWYLNCAVQIETRLDPHHLLERVLEIETGAGRVRGAPARGARYADRTLDIDILLYGDEVVSDEDLQIPHPFLHERRFVLTPLADIAPQVEHPTLYQTILEILHGVQDSREILPYSP
jgi:2-amino-4-hydroxy-6-hydroxymethyldihydropteridine diphosphokinase